MMRPEHNKPKRHGMRFFVFLVLVGFVVIGIFGALSRKHQAHTLKNETQQALTLSVNVIKPEQLTVGGEIILPGTVKAWHEASLSARVNGYLKNWYKDIGDHVRAGDVLAELDTPETDAQLHQADADLALAVANNNLAQVTAQRWLALVKTDSVTKQETDEKVADAAAKTAAVQSSTANRDRLRDLEAFKRIIAPFDGVVTARSTDIGALINQNGTEIYHLATTDKLRVYVSIPENDAPALTMHSLALVQFSEYPTQMFPARLLNTASAIDPSTRTLLTQFVLENPDGKLFPGGYCQVHLISPNAPTSLRLPANAFLFQSAGLQVAIVDAQHKIELKTVKPGRDFGKSIEVLAGLSPQDDVVINPADSFYQGETVEIAPPVKADGGLQQQNADDQKKKDGQSSSSDSSSSDNSGDKKQSTGEEEKKEAHSKDPNIKDDAKK